MQAIAFQPQHDQVSEHQQLVQLVDAMHALKQVAFDRVWSVNTEAGLLMLACIDQVEADVKALIVGEIACK